MKSKRKIEDLPWPIPWWYNWCLNHDMPWWIMITGVYAWGFLVFLGFAAWIGYLTLLLKELTK